MAQPIPMEAMPSPRREARPGVSSLERFDELVHGGSARGPIRGW